MTEWKVGDSVDLGCVVPEGKVCPSCYRARALALHEALENLRIRWTHKPPDRPGIWLRRAHVSSSWSLFFARDEEIRFLRAGDVQWSSRPLEIEEAQDEEH